MSVKKILALDDDEGILDVIKVILKPKGYQIKTITNFDLDQIFKIIDEFKPDLVLIDLLMPKIKGEEIIKKIKEESHYKNIHVVVLSASKDTENIAKESGADDFLYKPFDLNDLENIVEKHIYALH